MEDEEVYLRSFFLVLSKITSREQSLKVNIINDFNCINTSWDLLFIVFALKLLPNIVDFIIACILPDSHYIINIVYGIDNSSICKNIY